MRIDWRYPLIWGIETDAPVYCSLWLGWWLVTWVNPALERQWYRTIEIAFQPGL